VLCPITSESLLFVSAFLLSSRAENENDAYRLWQFGIEYRELRRFRQRGRMEQGRISGLQILISLAHAHIGVDVNGTRLTSGESNQ